MNIQNSRAIRIRIAKAIAPITITFPSASITGLGIG